jgi:TonB family protein
MFDRLIETEPECANFRNRRSYFMVSSLIVGVLFITAVVISIYASDYGLGSENFDLAMVVAPPEIPADIPQPPRAQNSANEPRSQAPASPNVPVVAILDDLRDPPKDISTTPNIGKAWDPKPSESGPLTGGRNIDGTGPRGIGDPVPSVKPAPDPDPEPPPVKAPVDTKPKPPTILRSKGPVNGNATYLPKPPYPATAVALNIQGKVDVQVTIDEHGKITSANAVSGNLLFRAAAEKAAWQAKFNPTYLGDVPMKVTGVIIYNFIR